jgi:hypothetical protein
MTEGSHLISQVGTRGMGVIVEEFV